MKKKKYSKVTEHFDEILEELKNGVSINKACKRFGIARTTFTDYAYSTTELGDKYMRARQIGYELLADDLLDIADDGTNDYLQDETGKPIINHDHLQRSRLRIDTRKWILCKMIPKVYGDKTQLEHTGDLSLKNLNNDDIDKRILELLTKSQET